MGSGAAAITGEGVRLPSPTYFQTGGDLPAVGQANLHAPDEYQPHPMHVWPNSPQLRKSSLNVEIQTGRRERVQVPFPDLFPNKRSLPVRDSAAPTTTA